MADPNLINLFSRSSYSHAQFMVKAVRIDDLGRFFRIFAAFLVPFGASLIAPAQAEPGDSAMAKFAGWFLSEGGPALKKDLGQTGNGAARQSIPVWIENRSGRAVTFAIESASCGRTSETLEPDYYNKYDCSANNEDRWYNISFDGKTYSVDAATFHIFEYGPNGKLDLFDYTKKAKKHQ